MLLKCASLFQNTAIKSLASMSIKRFGKCHNLHGAPTNHQRNISYQLSSQRSNNNRRKWRPNGKTFLPSLVLLASVLKSDTEELLQNENKDIIDLLKKGRKMFVERCSIEKVEEVYIEALHLALSRKNQSVIASVQDQLANLALRTNQLQKAEELYRNVIRNLLDSGKKENDPAILEISLKLATIYAGLGNIEYATNGYVWVTETIRKNVTELNSSGLKDESDRKTNNNQFALLGMALDSYGRFLFMNGKGKEALEATQEAKDICVELFSENDIRTIVLYNDIGTILHQMGNVDEALKTIQKAIDLTTKLDQGALHSDLAVFWVNLGNIYSVKEQNEKAKEAFDNAKKEADLSKDIHLQKRVEMFIKTWESKPKK